jgi:hypothetical protein
LDAGAEGLQAAKGCCGGAGQQDGLHRLGAAESQRSLRGAGVLASGVDPEAQLRAAIDDILARHADADLFVITSDLCNDGDPEAYELLREILSSAPFPVLPWGNRASLVSQDPKAGGTGRTECKVGTKA